MELISKGFSQREIARTLQVALGTVNKNILFLRQQVQEKLKTQIQDKLPEEYQHCLTGINQVLKLSWEIAGNSRENKEELNDNGHKTLTVVDDKTRLQALSLFSLLIF